MPIRRPQSAETADLSDSAALPLNLTTAVPIDTPAASAEPQQRPKRNRRKPAASSAQAAPQPPAAPAEAAINHHPVEEQQPAALANVMAMPALDAPALNAQEPAISYKIDFSDRSSWHASTDGGETKTAIGSPAIAGSPVDFILQISKARKPSGFYTHDYRLRLAFYTPDRELGELNLTAINVTAAGELYATSPARSLVGALLAISESEDDMLAFTEAARFTIKPGSGRGVFVGSDLASNGRWVAMASPTNTTAICKDADGFMAQLALIKRRFRGAGLLLTSQAISGDASTNDAIDVAAAPA